MRESLKPLEAALRSLPAIPVPDSLCARLLRTIPPSRSPSPVEKQSTPLRRTWVSAAAVILLCLLIVLLNYAPRLSPPGSITEGNVASHDNNVVDHNAAGIVDTNHAALLDR